MTTFNPPHPGHWILDRSHFDSGMTALSDELMGGAANRAYAELFATLGVPLRSVEFVAINGFPYGRSVPLIEPPGGGTRQPPSSLLRLLVRVVPAFRRRNRAAADFLAAPTSGAVVQEWESTIKPQLLVRNSEFAAVDLQALNDEALAAHVQAVVAYVSSTFEEHHRLHGYDLIPIGMLLVACRDDGIDTDRVLPILTGASPATTEPLADRIRIRELVADAGVVPTSLEDIHNASPEASSALTTYLSRHGGVLFSSYDIDSPTLGERPDVVLASIMSASPVEDPKAAVAEQLDRLRAEVSDVDEFDRLVAEARAAMNMRDDNGPLTVEWPAGLLRLGLLEVGRRLASSGRFASAEHVFELTVDEVDAIQKGSSEPSAEELSRRADKRQSDRSLTPPATLGPDQPDPDLSIFPDATARMLDIVTFIGDQMLTSAQEPAVDDSIRGIGIGQEPFQGVARLAETASEALGDMQDGEILVTRVTSPAFNLVLSLAGGLVTSEGGAMSHAAVLARELELPSVIGAVGCLDVIANGDIIRVDPVEGLVEVVERR